MKKKKVQLIYIFGGKRCSLPLTILCLCAFVALWFMLTLKSLEVKGETNILVADLVKADVNIREDFKIYVEGEEIKTDVPPVEFQGIIYVPIRFVAQSLGAEVNWRKDEDKVEIKRYKREIELKIGEEVALINGEKNLLLSPPFIYSNRTMVPLKWTATKLGAEVKEKKDRMDIEVKGITHKTTAKFVPVKAGIEKKDNPQVGVVTERSKHPPGVGWASRGWSGIRSKIKFLLVEEARLNPNNRVMAPLVIVLWFLNIFLFFRGRKKNIRPLSKKEKEDIEKD